MLRVLALTFVFSAIGLSQCLGGFVVSLGARWDAAPRSIAGNERSLQGGIRYAVDGGSLEAFRGRFTWQTLPSVTDFGQAVSQAFDAWTSVDPTSGLGTSLGFVLDGATSVVRQGGFGTLNINGAEIDLLASDSGSSGLMGLTAIGLQGTPVTLTSGVADYASSVSIQGVDIHLNSNPQAIYTLDIFRRILTHEIGHAIGLGDVDQGGQFIDDNYDSSSAVATLTNSWAGLVDPFDPANSAGLSTFNVPPANFALAGVDILMESNGLGTSFDNPLSELVPLRNDDYAMRQFLYPSVSAVPEPSSLALLALFGLGAIGGRRLKMNSNLSRVQWL